MVLTQEGKEFIDKWALLFADNEFENITEETFRTFAGDAAQLREKGQYRAVQLAGPGFTAQAILGSEAIEPWILYAIKGTPDPTDPTGLAGTWNQSGKEEIVYLPGLFPGLFASIGWVVDGGVVQAVQVDVAAGTAHVPNYGNDQEAETIAYADLLAELTSAGVVRQKWFRITQRTNGQPDVTVYFTNPGDPSGFGDDATPHLQPNGQTTLNRWAKYSLATDDFAYDTSLSENEYVRGDANGNIIVGTQAASHSIGGQQNLITGGEDNHIVAGNCNTIAGGSGNQIDGGDFNAITNSFGSSIPASCTYVQLLNCQAFTAPAGASHVTYLNNQPVGATYTDTDAAAAAAAALVAGNAQHQGIQASLNAGQVVLTVAAAKEDIVGVFPVNTISVGEIPIVYSKWAGTYQNYSTQNVTQIEIKVNGAVAVFPLTLALGDIVRITATTGGGGTGIVTLLHA